MFTWIASLPYFFPMMSWAFVRQGLSFTAAGRLSWTIFGSSTFFLLFTSIRGDQIYSLKNKRRLIMWPAKIFFQLKWIIPKMKKFGITITVFKSTQCYTAHTLQKMRHYRGKVDFQLHSWQTIPKSQVLVQLLCSRLDCWYWSRIQVKMSHIFNIFLASYC